MANLMINIYEYIFLCTVRPIYCRDLARMYLSGRGNMPRPKNPPKNKSCLS